MKKDSKKRGRERTNVSTRVLKNAKTSRCSYFSIPFGCRERDRDTIVPDNPYKLARSLLIKFIELIRDLHRDNCSLSTWSFPLNYEKSNWDIPLFVWNSIFGLFDPISRSANLQSKKKSSHLLIFCESLREAIDICRSILYRDWNGKIPKEWTYCNKYMYFLIT